MGSWAQTGFKCFLRIGHTHSSSYNGEIWKAPTSTIPSGILQQTFQNNLYVLHKTCSSLWLKPCRIEINFCRLQVVCKTYKFFWAICCNVPKHTTSEGALKFCLLYDGLWQSTIPKKIILYSLRAWV